MDIQYGKMIKTGENVFVIFTKERIVCDSSTMLAGIRIVFKNVNEFDQDNEAAIDFELDMTEPGLSEEDNKLMDFVVKANSETLWKKHPNLNGIHISAVRTCGGKAFRENCIVLCCKFKGFLTDDDKEFPTELKTDGICYPVDVRESETVSLADTSRDKLEPLACGGCIVGSCNDNRYYGTIGPFVELENKETGFLTCAHVLDNNPSFGIVEGRNDLVYQPEKQPEMLCGKVFRMSFRPNGNPSMDAAIVNITSEIRIPHAISFVAIEQAALNRAGIADDTTFNTGSIGNYLPNSSVLKFGAFTPTITCKCTAIGIEEKITYPHDKVLMKGLSKVICREIHQKGDSGAGVYITGHDRELKCVGLFFAGKGREGFFIPIKSVLTEFNNCQLKKREETQQE